MKTNKTCISIALILILLLIGLSGTAQITKVWDKVIGSRGLDRLQCANPTKDGGFIISGVSDKNPGGGLKLLGYGGTDIWVIKLKADQKTIEWQKVFGGINDEGMGNWYLPGSYIEQTSDGGYIFGTSSKSGISGNKTSTNKGDKDFWILKLDSLGNITWDKDFGGINEDELSVVHEINGGYIVGGSSKSPLGGDKSFNPYGGIGDEDYWVLKLNQVGAKIWDYGYGGNNVDVLSSMLVLKNNNHILLGGSSYSAAFTGNKTASNKGKCDYWVIEIDGNSGVYGDQSYGGNDNEFLVCMDVDYNNPEIGIALLLAGTSKSDISGDKLEINRDSALQTTDMWIVKSDLSGAIEWDKTLGVSFFDDVKDAKFLLDHNIIIGGSSSQDLAWGGWEWGPGTDKSEAHIGNNKGNDIWVYKLKGATGARIWDKTL